MSSAFARDFPCLQQEVHGHPLVFLDSAASAQKPTQVIEAQADVLRHSYANIHRGVYALSERATDLHDGAREKVRNFLNAESKREIVFPRNRHRGDQPPRPELRPPERQRGRRDPDHRHGAPRQYRSLATARRAVRHEAGGRPHYRRGRAYSGGVRSPDHVKDQTGRGYLGGQRARHGQPGGKDERDGPCQGCPGLSRRRPGRAAYAGRRAGARRRFSRFHRPQALRPLRHRCALRQGRPISKPCRPGKAAAT